MAVHRIWHGTRWMTSQSWYAFILTDSMFPSSIHTLPGIRSWTTLPSCAKFLSMGLLRPGKFSKSSLAMDQIVPNFFLLFVFERSTRTNTSTNSKIHGTVYPSLLLRDPGRLGPRRTFLLSLICMGRHRGTQRGEPFSKFPAWVKFASFHSIGTTLFDATMKQPTEG